MATDADYESVLMKKKDIMIKGEPLPLTKKPNPLKQIYTWAKNLPVYLKVRDLNNDEATPCENRPRPAAEVGIKISF